MRARDMAKFGQLFLQEGVWEGEQIIPHEWVMISTAPHKEAPGIWDYGYHWWTHPQYPNYAAIGLGGQTVMVFPARNLVIVFTAEGSPPLNALVDAYIIPSIRD
jgi:CubicO group peptidase (beta-lactamase class C family)